MRREELSAAARRALHGLRADDADTSETPLPSTAIGALAAGLLLATGILVITESRAPAVDAVHEQSDVPEAEYADAVLNGDQASDEAIAFAAMHEPAPGDQGETRWFNGRPIRPATTITMTVTAYSPDERSCGKWADGFTASGYSVWTNGMKLVAADTSLLPFGSLLSIPGYDSGEAVPVLDRGGAIKGHRLDVLFPTHEQAMEWGIQELEVTVWEYADGKPNDFKQNHARR